MSKHSAQEVAEAAQNVAESADHRARAIRALSDFKKGNADIVVSEQNIRLYLGLRQLNPSGRVTASQILQQKTAAVSQVLLKQKLWLVPKENFKQLPKDMLPYVVDPSTLEDVPADLDASSVWVLDQAIDRNRLGRCVMEFESSFGHRRSANAAAPSKALTDDSAPQSSGASPAPRPAAPASEEPPVKKARVLQQKASDPEEDTFEKIATATKEAFEAGRFVSADKGSSGFAEFWLRGFTKYAQNYKNETQVPPYMKAYISFVVQNLLQNECHPAVILLHAPFCLGSH